MSEAIILFAWLLFGHALADYPLQGDFLSRAKNRLSPIPGVPWYQALGAHAVIHAGFVGLITANIWLVLAEFVFHFAIDDAKCSGKFGQNERAFNIDQLCHVGCKLAWTIVLFA